jgi:hypothetical protein
VRWTLSFEGLRLASLTPTSHTSALWRWLSSGLYRRVVWYKFSDISEVLPASIIRVTHRPNDRGSQYLRNVCKLLPDQTARKTASHFHTRRTENLFVRVMSKFRTVYLQRFILWVTACTFDARAASRWHRSDRTRVSARLVRRQS